VYPFLFPPLHLPFHRSRFGNSGGFRFISTDHKTLVVHTTVLLLLLLFWVVTPCGLADRRESFGETYCVSLNLRAQTASQLYRHSYKNLKLSSLCSLLYIHEALHLPQELTSHVELFVEIIRLSISHFDSDFTSTGNVLIVFSMQQFTVPSLWSRISYLHCP
jgi:hypothetical protein